MCLPAGLLTADRWGELAQLAPYGGIQQAWVKMGCQERNDRVVTGRQRGNPETLNPDTAPHSVPIPQGQQGGTGMLQGAPPGQAALLPQELLPAACCSFTPLLQPGSQPQTLRAMPALTALCFAQRSLLSQSLGTVCTSWAVCVRTAPKTQVRPRTLGPCSLRAACLGSAAPTTTLFCSC